MAELCVSGAECVEALCLAGFRVRRRTAGQTVLVRGPQTVVIPDALVLTDDALDAIVDQANLSVDRLLWLLGEVTTADEIVCEA